MLCTEFEDRLTDYLDGALEGETQRAFGEHALRCPVCHDLLNEVKNAIVECRADMPPQPTPGLEARILLKTAPETAMKCEEFEEYLTDYLDGFLPATLYHRWERHAALCNPCSDLPGQVVRAIGACSSYIGEELPVPAGLHARILQATLGTDVPFFEQSSLGGQNNLRGYGVDRFIDKHLIAASIEERIHLARTKIAGVAADFEMATFLDTGQVFNSYKDVSFKDYRMTPGIGFRGIVRPNVVGRIDYGFSKEGGAIFAGLDFPY